MNRSLCVVCDSVRKVWQPVGEVLGLTRHENENSIVDHYKGMQIHVHAQSLGRNGWRCSIRICNAPYRALQNVCATVHATDEIGSLQAALGFAFTEAMSLCDLLLERKRAQ